MITACYRIPRTTGTETIMRATLQTTPEEAARKSWLKLRTKARDRGETIAVAATELINRTKELGVVPDTDIFTATKERTTTCAVVFWRKQLQQENNRYILKLRVGNLAQPLQRTRKPPDDANAKATYVSTKRECPCGYHAFTQEHVLEDCPYTEPWRDAVTLRGTGGGASGQNGLCDVPALVNRIKGIWMTPDLTWKEQAKVKRKLLQPIGDFAKGWH